jgi:hypothetical protein
VVDILFGIKTAKKHITPLLYDKLKKIKAKKEQKQDDK